MRNYKALKEQEFKINEYRLTPIRSEDRYLIMQWRNEQIYHLRQTKVLTKEDQDKYFEETIESLFKEKFPSQLLFSFLRNEECIGYGGLVHINWIDKNAEISFLMNTQIENESFTLNWTLFLKGLEQFAFNDLKLHKIYVYAFDLRPKLYSTLELNDYFLDARLDSHCLFQKEYKDVVIYSKINNK